MLTLRPYSKCDAETIAMWIRDEKTLYQWSADLIGVYPMPPEVLQKHYEKQENNPDFMTFTACDESHEPVGHLFIKYQDEEHKKVRFGFVIVDSSLRGKGYGKEMLMLAKKYAFEFLRAEEITLGVFSNNPKAFHCYQSVGFEECGEHVMCKINGEDWEHIEMICLPG